MEKKRRLVNINDILDEDLEKITFQLHAFTSGLLRIRSSSILNSRPELQGSASMVMAGGRYGLLTAHHVAQNFDRRDEVGIFLEDRKSIFFSVPFESLEVISLSTHYIEGQIPDLSLILLPESPKLQILRQFKSFLNLDKAKQRMGSKDLEIERGLLILNGVVGSSMTIEQSNAAKEKILGFDQFAGITEFVKVYKENGFDLVDVGVSYFHGSTTPSSFGGYSGGGLWQVPFSIDQNGRVDRLDYFLAGVTIKQSDIVNDKRIITCHGRNSIYIDLLDALN